MKTIKKRKYRILKILLKGGFVLTIALSFLMPIIVVHAHKKVVTSPSPTPTPSPTPSPTLVTPPAPAGGLQINTTINNPLGNGHLSTIPAFIEGVLKIVLDVGVPIVTLAIIYAGFLFVQAQGNPEKLTKAKDTLLYTLIGAALLLGAYVLANAIGSTVDQIINNT